MPRTGYIDHIGIGVLDLTAAKRYYDELMPVLGLRQWFKTSPAGPFNYGPAGGRGTQLFFYQAHEPGTYSRRRTGLQHLAFLVASRAVVREAHPWARAHDAEILNEPRAFPEYGPHCYATYWLDPHGIMLEAVRSRADTRAIRRGPRWHSSTRPFPLVFSGWKYDSMAAPRSDTSRWLRQGNVQASGDV